MLDKGKIEKGINEYYTDKVMQHGDSPLGVDWNSRSSQYQRFTQLVKIIDKQKFDILDYGCGYGGLVDFFESSKYEYNYYGYDISEEMIKRAEVKFGEEDSVTFSSQLPEEKFDYIVASGIFNVKLDLASDSDWYSYIIETINLFNQRSTSGFAFNALTKYSDKEFMKDYLFYSDPLTLFDYCKKNFSRNVALLHDYDLYEFTILVRK